MSKYKIHIFPHGGINKFAWCILNVSLKPNAKAFSGSYKLPLEETRKSGVLVSVPGTPPSIRHQVSSLFCFCLVPGLSWDIRAANNDSMMLRLTTQIKTCGPEHQMPSSQNLCLLAPLSGEQGSGCPAQSLCWRNIKISETIQSLRGKTLKDRIFLPWLWLPVRLPGALELDEFWAEKPDNTSQVLSHCRTNSTLFGSCINWILTSCGLMEFTSECPLAAGDVPCWLPFPPK